MSAGYASRLKEFPNKGVCGLPEQRETTRSYTLKRQQLLTLVKQAAGRVVVLTGAGVSTSAGIPDFRGPKGIWTLEKQHEKRQRRRNQNKKQPQEAESTITPKNGGGRRSASKRKRGMVPSPERKSTNGMSVNDADDKDDEEEGNQDEEDNDSNQKKDESGASSSSSPSTTATMDFSHAQPSLTHRALYYLTEHWVDIQNESSKESSSDEDEQKPNEPSPAVPPKAQPNNNPLISFCVTQNVDGLHRRSGMRRERLAILHGCVFTEKCQACGLEHFLNHDVGGMSFGVTGRFCTECQQPLRDTLLDWQDPLPEDDHERAMAACDQAELVLCLGTSLRIEPAGSLPTRAKRYVIINLQETPYDAGAALLIRAKVDQVMRDLMRDLGLDETSWNVPIQEAQIQRTWRNPEAKPNFLRNWWKNPPPDSDDEEEEEEEQAAI